MDQNKNNTPSHLESWVFWQKQYAQHPQMFGDWKFGQVWPSAGCKFCDGYRSAQHDGKFYYCLCSLTKWLVDRHIVLREVETTIVPAKLNELRPLKAGGGAELSLLQRTLVEWVKAPAKWFLISGGTGTGKTHILRAIKTYFGTLAFFISAEDLNSAIFRSLSAKTTDDLILSLSGTPLLLIDDLGIQHNNTMFTDTLAQVVNRRYNAGPERFPLIITTNLGIANMVNSPDLALRRIASRVCDEAISNVIFLPQPDYRLPTTKKE